MPLLLREPPPLQRPEPAEQGAHSDAQVGPKRVGGQGASAGEAEAEAESVGVSDVEHDTDGDGVADGDDDVVGESDGEADVDGGHSAAMTACTCACVSGVE